MFCAFFRLEKIETFTHMLGVRTFGRELRKFLDRIQNLPEASTRVRISFTVVRKKAAKFFLNFLEASIVSSLA